MTSVVPQNQNRCVFVGNIPYDATEEHLIQICEEVGPVVSFRLVVDKETGKPKGYGFCEYKDEETALSARRNLQSYEINGRQLRVDFAENGKNVDRNRDQGRGGPGAGIDGQKQLSGNSNMKESMMTQQPLGIPSAASASSVMSGVLGGSLNGLASQPGPDPLTNYLARMSRPQLMEILSEIKSLATQNMGVARQLLERNPQLLKALFQAEIMLGLATPQAIQQIGSNSRPPPHLGQSQLPPKPVAPTIRPLVPQNPNLVAPSQNPNLVAPLQNRNVPPPPIMQQNTRPTYEVGTVPNQRPPPVPVPVPVSVPSSSMQQSFYACPSSQVVRKQEKQWSETTRPSKQRRLDQPVPQNVPPVNPLLAQTQPQPQKPTQQISPEVESALLQQVLSLTPDQLSSLPVEQQQQVLHLQKMLSSSSR